MHQKIPPKIELNDGIMGPVALLWKGKKNFVAALPKAVLTKPFLFGRMLWRGYAVTGADEVKHVLAKNAANYPRSRVVKCLVGPPIEDSFFCADMDTHRWQRRAILRHYGTEKSQRHVAYLKELLEDEAGRLPDQEQFVFDAEDYIERFTLRSSLRSNCATYSPDNLDQLRLDLRKYSRRALQLSLSEILTLPPIFRPFGRKNLFKFRRGLRAEIKKRKADPKRQHDDLMGMLLHLKNPETGAKLSERDVLGNTSMMIIAAHEPTANVLSWLIYLLATHPDIQTRARTEILNLEPDDSFASLKGAEFLHAVIYETMRLYSVGPVLLRDSLEDDAIKGCPVHRKSFVFVSSYALHRSPEHWDQPDAFMPDRFLKNQYPKDAYIPFSVGPQSCVGKEFAMTEMLVFAADFLRRFEFRAASHTPPSPKAIMAVYPDGGVWIEAKARSENPKGAA